MANLVSPGVSVTVINESFYTPGGQATVPLIFIATAENKTQADGVSPAIGSMEYGVVRTVTSKKQALELYGVPKFYEDSNGNPHHGDARNEYGLDALMKYLDVGNRAYVVRANVNLDDTYNNIANQWTALISEASDYLNTLVNDAIAEYNALNGLVPGDATYKRTVTKTELTQLLDVALEDVFKHFSFSSQAFKNAFMENHLIDHPAYQDVIYDATNGYIQGTDVTGLQNDTTQYGFELNLVSSNGTETLQVAVQGQNAQTYADLVVEIANGIATAQGLPSATATVELIQGRIRITSDLDGATSQVEIISNSFSGVLPLFPSTNLYSKVDAPVVGRGINPLSVYDSTFTNVIGSYDGMDALVANWNVGGTVATEFTGLEAAGLLIAAANDFDNTKEFLNETSLGANDAEKRQKIVEALNAAILDPNTNVTSERMEYNLVTCPGYPETSSTLLSLVAKIREEAFVIGETPMDKAPSGPNGITEWATSTAKENDWSIAYWYPHGLSSNIDGKTILTTAASTALRTIAYNDRESEVFFAPGGTARGRCPHLDDIGYVTGVLGSPTTFVQEWVDEGTRDDLYEFPKTINPISYIYGRGILVMGQKTTEPTFSALDRINVSRLVKFIKRNLRKSLFPYLFEPIDEITFLNAKATAEGFLSDLIDRRGLYDFAVKVDDENNTPERIDRNELWVDVAIKPVKAVEFIYVPVHVVRTGTDIGTGRQVP